MARYYMELTCGIILVAAAFDANNPLLQILCATGGGVLTGNAMYDLWVGTWFRRLIKR